MSWLLPAAAAALPGFARAPRRAAASSASAAGGFGDSAMPPRRLRAICAHLCAPAATEAGLSVETDVAPSTFETLGVAPLINAQGHITTLGGSLMPPPVVEAMNRAARSFVQLNDLHGKAGDHIARLIGAPAAFVCNGAASGMFLCGAAVLSGGDSDRARALPDTGGRPNEFVISQVEGWHETIGQGFVLAGGTLVKVGTRTDNPTAEEYAAAITDRTAAVVYFKGTQTLEDLRPVVDAAHARGVPVIVDCAAQLPPKSNLKAVLASGADLAVFSGGKGFMGPQASGLVIGSPALVSACRACSAPNGGPGRAQKVGKEEIMGLVAAVELFLATDERALYVEWERRIAIMAEATTGVAGVTASTSSHFDRRQLNLDFGELRSGLKEPKWEVSHQVGNLEDLRSTRVLARLASGNPAIVAARGEKGRDALRLDPHTLQEGEAEVVAKRLREALLATQ